MLRQSGFRSTITVVPGIAQPGIDLHEIPRFCENVGMWQAPNGGFSRALVDVNLTGMRGWISGLRAPESRADDD